VEYKRDIIQTYRVAFPEHFLNLKVTSRDANAGNTHTARFCDKVGSEEVCAVLD